jgi:hypothetical protein
MKLAIAATLAALVAVPAFAQTASETSLAKMEHEELQMAAAGHWRMPHDYPIDPDLYHRRHKEHTEETTPFSGKSYWSFKHWTVVAPYGAGVASIPVVDKDICDVVIKSMTIPGHTSKPICINGITGEIYEGK